MGQGKHPKWIVIEGLLWYAARLLKLFSPGVNTLTALDRAFGDAQILPYMKGNFLYFKPNLTSEKGVCIGGREGSHKYLQLASAHFYFCSFYVVQWVRG